MRTLLIDGDIVIYKAAFGSEVTHRFDEDNWSTTANELEAQQTLVSLISRLQASIKDCDEVIVALSDDLNWRKTIYPDYKAQRKKVRRPILLKPLKAWVADNYRCFIRPTLEADDVLGILATGNAIPGDKVIATIDKDLLQIPGKHLHIDKLTKRVVTETEGDLLHLMQTLTGDVVDNYPGCPGMGPVSAAKLINEADRKGDRSVGELWPHIVNAYASKGLTEEDALVQARISRICRASDYSISTRSVLLWTPPSP